LSRHRHQQQAFRAVHTWLAPVLRDGRRSAGSDRDAALSGHDGWAAMCPSRRTQTHTPAHPDPRPANIPGQLAIVRVATPGRPTRVRGSTELAAHAAGAKAEAGRFTWGGTVMEPPEPRKPDDEGLPR
jgi:hypothetical protein